MASITYDGQSFLLDGRRVWLVSGSIHYARTPRAQWAERIHAAKHAGLNCIETPVVWARHEPRHNQFDFTGENDIREFVKLVHAAGMFCIIRPGPFIDHGYDMGGLPAWLQILEGVKLRTANHAYLEACSRYITALAGQLRDLQVNSPTPKGTPAGVLQGPIILLQNESGFTCGDDHLADTYLSELDRYWREAGFSVPIINSNDLWQSVEGEIDGWTGYDGLLGHLRQLGTIRPAQPRIVVDFKLGQTTTVGRPAPSLRSPGAIVRRLAEVLAAGGQFNIDAFSGGTNFGFSTGREHALGHAAFVTTSADCGAIISETGEIGEHYAAVRRICTFASRFSRVLSHIDPARQPVALMPEAAPSSKDHKHGARVAVLHAVGSQGGVVFVFGDDDGHNAPEPMNLLLSDGSTLPVQLGTQSVMWCLLETRLTGRANLDYCNVSAMALVGKVLVCFGAAGSRAMLSINGSPLEANIPEAKASLPFIHEHEGITVVIANQEQVDHLSIDDHAVYIGVLGLDRSGKPIVADDAKTYTHIDGEGKVTTVKVHHPHNTSSGSGSHAVPANVAHISRKSSRVTLGEWAFASCADHATGSSPRYASVNTSKPHDLVSLGAPSGYGWYRLKFSSGSARKVKVMFPQAAHRLHLTLDGEPVGLVGVGPGTESTIALNLKKGSHDLVVLAENAGRVSSGADLGELTGIYGPVWEVEALKIGKPKVVAADPVDLLAFRAPLWKMHRDDRSDAHRFTWTLPHRSKNPVIIEIGPFEDELATGSPEREAAMGGGLLMLNGKPVHYFQQGGGKPIILQPDVLLKGNNEIQITLASNLENAHAATVASALAKHVTFYDAADNLTAKAEWSFAKWEPPTNTAFTKGHKHTAGEPSWWKAEFTVANSASGTDSESLPPLILDCAGLTKGQIYVNGQHVCRYWVATGTGKKVAPQTRYVIPRSYLKNASSDHNSIMLFDEHGATPSKVRLVGDPKGGTGAIVR